MKNFWEKLPQPILALAPMAGVTDAAFRIMCKRGGADVIYTEFASSDALIYGSEKTTDMISFTKEESPVVVQIFGKDPKMMFKATKKVQELGFDGVDINFGCPAYKVVRHGGGVCLMRNLPLVREIVSAVTEAATEIPVSIKIRGSIKSEDKKTTTHAIDLMNVIKDLPVKALMIHGRSFEKPFDGELDTNSITDVVRMFPGIILANGGVNSPEKAQSLLHETGAQGLGIARGAWGKPWIFSQIKDYLQTGAYKEKSRDELNAAIIEHAQLAFKMKNRHGIIELRKHLSWYVKGMEGASLLRQQLVSASSIEDIQKII
ncbi:MAG: tRNA-dihydrouridine synthase [Patescibacteria group bacterium]|jgi:nifR3 family TIM-barrel protein